MGSAASSAWVPVNSRQTPFNVAVAVDFNSAASGITYTVEHTLDDPFLKRSIASITRSTTTVTVTFPTADPHGLSTGDTITVEGSGITGMDGTFNVTVTNTTVLTYTSGTSATSTGDTQCRVITMRIWPHEFLASKTAADDGNYAYPVAAIRLTLNAWSAGQATLLITQGK